MKAHTELKKKTAAELTKELAAVRLELIKLNAQVNTGAASKEAGKIRGLRKKVARILTIERQKQ